LIIGGAITFGTAYFVTLVAASAYAEAHPAKSDDALPLFVPVAGPWIGIGTMNTSSVGTGWLITDGLVQAAGVAMFAGAFIWPKKRFLRDDLAAPGLRLQPMVLGKGGTGLGVAGRF
jgi:hypothetical protein